MVVPMMQVRIVGMFVRHWIVAMRMRVWLGSVPRKAMFMPMMHVVRMRMTVGEHLMRMFVFVTLEQVEHDPGAHQ